MTEKIAEYFKTQPVLKAWLFGSFARGEDAKATTHASAASPSDSDITHSTTALLSCPHCGTVLSTSLSVFTKSTKNDREL